MKRRHSESDSDESVDTGTKDASEAADTVGADDELEEHQSSRKKRRGIIEKRRRDRINNSLNELRRLVPAAYEKQGSAKLEKAEILQMTVEHLKMLHQGKLEGKGAPSGDIQFPESQCFDYRSLGFRECAAEVARYLTSVEGLDMRDPLRIRLMQHLQAYFAQREALAAAQVAAQAVIHPGSSWHQARGAGSLHSTPSYAMGAITRGTPVLPGVPSHGATSLYPYFQPGASPVGSSLKSEGNPSLLTSSGGHTIPSHSSTPSVSVSQPFKLADLPYMSATFPQGAGQPSGSAATVKSPYMGWGGELVF